MKRARFRVMLRWAVAGPVTLLALLALTFLILIRWLNSQVDLVDHTDQVISAAQETQALLIDMETGVRGYLLTNDPAFLAPYRKAAPVFHPALSALRHLVADSPSQTVAVTRIEGEYNDWLQLAEEMLSGSANADALDEAQIAEKGQMDTIRHHFATFVGVEEGVRAQRTAAVRRNTRTVVATSALATFLFGIMAAFFSRRALQTVASDYEMTLIESEAARTRAESLARENERLFLEARSASRAKDEFLATLSHELRTPLTSILGWSRLLQLQGPDRDNLDVALEAIERSARSQAALIEDILDVSRIITGKMKLEVSDGDVRDAVRHAAESVQPAANGKRIRIEIDAPEEVRLSADPNRLQQIIWNLLANAVKFSPSETTVRVSARRNEENVVITVADQGQGIDAGFLPFVFDRFRQADSSSTREYGGLGIGLAVVKLLVDLHGGTVQVDSPGLGQGATFTVTLPARRPPVSAGASPARTGGRDLLAEIGQPLTGHDLLIVDDDADARAVLTAILGTFGGRIESASSVAEAMRLLGRHRFAVILTDIAMPQADGFSLLERVRTTPGPNIDTPVIAITALASVASGSGGVEFATTIRKPVDPAALVSAVASIIR